MGLGNKFNFGDDTNLAEEEANNGGDDGLACSICLETVAKDGDRSWANLQCGHQFHLDCIGSAFNAKGVMQCPNCRKVEKGGQWRYANGCRSSPEFNVEDWVQEEDIYDIGAYSEMSFGVHWCPFGSSTRLPSFEDGEFSSSSYHDLVAQQAYFTEPAAPTAGHPCPYVTYFGPVHSSSSTAAAVSESSSFGSHWNSTGVGGSSVPGEVPTTPYGFPVVDPHFHSWDYHHSPPPPQHFSASAAARTSRANGSDVIRTRPPQFMRPFHNLSSGGRAGSSAAASVPRTPVFPGSNARNRDRIQALQAYYQQASAQPDSRGPLFPSSGRRPGRGISSSGMGSTSSSSSDQQGGGSGFIRFNIWERDYPYMQSQSQPQQQAYPVNQMDREPSLWTSDGSGSFHQRHGGGGGGGL